MSEISNQVIAKQALQMLKNKIPFLEELKLKEQKIRREKSLHWKIGTWLGFTQEIKRLENKIKEMEPPSYVYIKKPVRYSGRQENLADSGQSGAKSGSIYS